MTITSLVVRKTGSIHRVATDGAQTLFVDMADKISSSPNEAGLLGVRASVVRDRRARVPFVHEALRDLAREPALGHRAREEQ